MIYKIFFFKKNIFYEKRSHIMQRRQIFRVNIHILAKFFHWYFAILALSCFCPSSHSSSHPSTRPFFNLHTFYFFIFMMFICLSVYLFIYLFTMVTSVNEIQLQVYNLAERNIYISVKKLK